MVHRKMNLKILYIIALLITTLFAINSCELIVIGKKPGEQKPTHYNRYTPTGSVVLFKTELDSNNVPAATDILASKDGKKLLALSRYEIEYEIERVRRVISKRTITNIIKDTISPHNIKVTLELDYYRYVSFNTSEINKLWYITNYEGI